MKPSFHDAASIMLLLKEYQKRFEKAEKDAEKHLGKETLLKDACRYSLQSGGKRLRPALVWMVADSLGHPEYCDLAALAVEYFHTASLIADDLPCMDNDDLRRGLPTTHKKYTEATALLASFALTAAGFDVITKSPIKIGDPFSVLKEAVTRSSKAVGILGLIGGQFFDLAPPNYSLETIEEIIDKKTCALFELSFCLGWLFSGGALEELSRVNALGTSFGRAFQVLDDIDDYDQDVKADKKINFAVRFGMPQANEYVLKNLQAFEKEAKALNLYSKPLQKLIQVMSKIAS